MHLRTRKSESARHFIENLWCTPSNCCARCLLALWKPIELTNITSIVPKLQNLIQLNFIIKQPSHYIILYLNRLRNSNLSSTKYHVNFFFLVIMHVCELTRCAKKFACNRNRNETHTKLTIFPSMMMMIGGICIN